MSDGIYIHIPFCKSKCTYCDFASFPSKIGFAEAYMACLYKEIASRAKAAQGRVFGTVYFGGGTPSVIDAQLIAAALKQVRRHYALADNAEITIEINPKTLDAEKLKAYKAAGINRFSVGMQSADDNQLKNLNRIHSVADYKECADLLRGENFNADILVGLKNQTDKDVIDAVELALSSGASHVSVYALTPEDGTPIYTDYLNGELPSADETADLYDVAYKMLTSRNFERYEVSNFSKKGCESKHNLNYWRCGEYLGFGVAASSYFNRKRFTNTYDLDEYIKCIISNRFAVVDEAQISDEDAKFEYVMLGLRTAEGISVERYNTVYGGNFYVDFAMPLKKHASRLIIDGDNVKIKDDYLYVQNSIIVDFLN